MTVTPAEDAAKVADPREDKLAILDSLVGIIPDDGITLERAKTERLARQ